MMKGKRTLKNGAVGAYVKQSDGSYKWRIVKGPSKKRVKKGGNMVRRPAYYQTPSNRNNERRAAKVHNLERNIGYKSVRRSNLNRRNSQTRANRENERLGPEINAIRRRVNNKKNNMNNKNKTNNKNKKNNKKQNGILKKITNFIGVTKKNNKKNNKNNKNKNKNQTRQNRTHESQAEKIRMIQNRVNRRRN